METQLGELTVLQPQQPQSQGRGRRWGSSGRRREVSGVCTVGSVPSWQAAQANITLLIRAAVAASLTLAKDLDVTLDKNNCPKKAADAACCLPKANGLCPHTWTGQAGALAQQAGPQAVPLPG